MPEYHNVQAYLSLEKRDQRQALALFRDVLAGITLANDARDEWLTALGDDLSATDGYAPNGPDLIAAIVGTKLDVRPLVHLWTPDVIPHLAAPWLETTLLLESERIEEWIGPEPRFQLAVEPALFQLVAAFLPISVDSPTFLTNEAGDGQPWETFTGGEGESWAFDLAIARTALEWPHGPLPSGFEGVELNEGVVIARRAAWQTSLDRMLEASESRQRK